MRHSGTSSSKRQRKKRGCFGANYTGIEEKRPEVYKTAGLLWRELYRNRRKAAAGVYNGGAALARIIQESKKSSHRCIKRRGCFGAHYTGIEEKQPQVYKTAVIA